MTGVERRRNLSVEASWITLTRTMDGLRRTGAVILSAAVLLGSVAVRAQTAPAGAEPDSEQRSAPTFDTFEQALAFADNAWVFGDFALVVEVLTPWLVPTPPPASDAVLRRAWERLGASAWYEDDSDLAESAFVELLVLDPRHRLDPFVHPAPLVQFYDEVREDRASELPVETPTLGGATVYVERRVQTQSMLVSMLPFGWGFFAAGRDGLGTTYLITEVALGATSAGLYWANEAARGADGLYDDATVPERRRRIQVVTGWSFFALLATNIVHGALAHRSITSVEYRTLTEPPSELVDPDTSMRPARRWQFRFAPVF